MVKFVVSGATFTDEGLSLLVTNETGPVTHTDGKKEKPFMIGQMTEEREDHLVRCNRAANDSRSCV
jgi:hypothetical protein